MTAYRDSQDHLADELERLLLLLRPAVLELRRTPLPVRETSALAILDEEIDWQLTRPLRRAAPGPEAQALYDAVDRFAAVIAGRVAASEGVPLRLAQVGRRFGLTRDELDTLVLVLAPELEARFERIVGYLHDDMTRRRVSVGLVVQVLARDDAGAAALRRGLAGAGTLVREGLLRRVEGEPAATSLSAPLVVAGRVIEFLQGSDEVDPQLRGVARAGGSSTSSPCARCRAGSHAPLPRAPGGRREVRRAGRRLFDEQLRVLRGDPFIRDINAAEGAPEGRANPVGT